VSTIDPGPEILEARKSLVGDGTEVRRLLPQRVLRTIGAWCFLDHYGPDDVSPPGAGMQVGPHPHIGLQTATWLFDGLVLHRDSLGTEQLIRPGQLNLMTSGRGIAHAEESPAPRSPLLHGVQLWIALPRDRQYAEPGFAHYADLPTVRLGDARVTVVVGELGDARSPAVVHTPLVGLEVTLPADRSVTLATRADFEYGVLSVDGPATVTVDGASGASGAPGASAASGAAAVEPGVMAHLRSGSSAITLSAAGLNRFFVIGGLPLGERLIMWWNFVARTADEIAAARDSWMAGDGRFGEVHGYHGDPLPAPPLPAGLLIPR
jgi:redox-sensitive bicupin YhaK (pirin superfamily)